MDIIFLQVFAEYYWNVLGIVKKRTRDMIRVKKLKLDIRARFDNNLIVDQFSLKHEYERIILPLGFSTLETLAYTAFRKKLFNVSTYCK